MSFDLKAKISLRIIFAQGLSATKAWYCIVMEIRNMRA